MLGQIQRMASYPIILYSVFTIPANHDHIMLLKLNQVTRFTITNFQGEWNENIDHFTDYASLAGFPLQQVYLPIVIR